jgi:enoyl-CoA hydratase
MSDFDTLTLQQNDNGIGLLTISRPKKLNALNNRVLDELSEAVLQIKANDDIQGIIISGAGEKAFVAGADIKELLELDEESGRKASQKGQQVFQSIEDLRKPVIAAVEGYALGGGAELAMACHMRITSPNSMFGLPEAGLGLIPGYGGTQRLPAIVGRAQALQMILSGKPVDAEEAFRIGLVNEVEDDPLQSAQKLMDGILSNAPLSIQSAIEAVYHSGKEDGFQVEADTFGKLCASDDADEGLGAFLEKREPVFEGKNQ